MEKFLLKTTEEYKLGTRAEVEEFHEELLKDAVEQNYTLTSFAYTKKEIKVKGEVVEEYFIVKAIKLFQTDKECCIPLNRVYYN